jgi:hypothetical protein
MQFAAIVVMSALAAKADSGRKATGPVGAKRRLTLSVGSQLVELADNRSKIRNTEHHIDTCQQSNRAKDRHESQVGVFDRRTEPRPWDCLCSTHLSEAGHWKLPRSELVQILVPIGSPIRHARYFFCDHRHKFALWPMPGRAERLEISPFGHTAKSPGQTDTSALASISEVPARSVSRCIAAGKRGNY